MLPRLSGIDVCRSIRATSTVPIIMVTAKSTELDTVVGLEVGADDYVAKPYRVHELVSRMRAVLRRAPSARASSALGRTQARNVAGVAPYRGGPEQAGSRRPRPDGVLQTLGGSDRARQRDARRIPSTR